MSSIHLYNTAPDDYVSQTEVSITIEESTATVSVAIVMDTIAETQETFDVVLSLPEDSDDFGMRVDLGSLTRATVFITDDLGDIIDTTH